MNPRGSFLPPVSYYLMPDCQLFANPRRASVLKDAIAPGFDPTRTPFQKHL
jgi:hypothetical protein